MDELNQKVLQEGEPIASNEEGYVRVIYYRRLIDIAAKHKKVLDLKCLPGDFVQPW